MESTLIRLLTILLILSSAVSDSVGQEKSSFFTLNGNVTIPNHSEGIHEYSAPAWGVGVGFARDLNNYVRLVAEASYERFAVDFQRIRSDYSSTSLPIVAEALEVYQVAASFRIAFTSSAVRPYASIGGGAMLFESGEISFVEVQPNWLRDDDPQVLGFVLVGLGTELPLTDFLLWSVGAQISAAFDVSSAVTFPITSRWYFRL